MCVSHSSESPERDKGAQERSDQRRRVYWATGAGAASDGRAVKSEPHPAPTRQLVRTLDSSGSRKLRTARSLPLLPRGQATPAALKPWGRLERLMSWGRNEGVAETLCHQPRAGASLSLHRKRAS